MYAEYKQYQWVLALSVLMDVFLCDYSLQIVYFCISGAIPSETSTKLSAEAPIKEGAKTLGNEAVSVIPSIGFLEGVHFPLNRTSA